MTSAGGAPVVVVGAGIAGLAAAWTLRSEGADVVVVESSSRTGGKLVAEPLAGHPVDAGADAFLARVPDAIDLCRELGLDDELVTPAQRSAQVLLGGRLRPLPEGLVLGVPTDLDALAASELVSDDALRLVASEPDHPAPPLDGDAAVGPYLRGRVGDEIFEVLVSPLLSGISAGDADQLSLDAGAPQVAAVAHAGGSLIRSLRDQRARAPDPLAPVFYSLAGGAGRLGEVLTERVGPVQTDAPVVAIGATTGGYLVEIEGRPPIAAAAVVIATPAFVTARLLGAAAPSARADLAALEYASVAVVTLAVPERAIGVDLAASGVLVPEREGLLVTACSWGSSKWPHWAEAGTAVLRLSVGRHHDTRHTDLDDATLVESVVAEVSDLLQISAPPDVARVARWPRGLPQYRPGHLQRVDAWEDELAGELPGVMLAGAATRGLGIPACIASGRRAARSVLRSAAG